MKIKADNFKKQIIGFLISFIIFALLNILFKNVSLFGNYADFRISAIFPVMSGLFFGLPGALGCAAGNLIADLFGTLNIGTPLGALANFLFAWLPYRMWHTLFPFDKHKIQYISSTNTLIKYIVITFFSTASSMAVLSAGCDILKIAAFTDFFKSVFICNLYFALFWGTTVFLLVSKVFSYTPYIPYKLYSSTYNHKKYLPDYIICSAIVIAVLLRFVFPVTDVGILENVFNYIIIACTLVLAFLPMRRGKISADTEKKYVKNKGLQSQLITGFFVFISISTGILVLLLSNIDVNLQGTDFDISGLLITIFNQANIFGLIFVLILIILLKWIERKITQPVITIANATNKFVENGLQTDLPDFNKVSDEISTLANSYNKMSSDIIGYIKTVEEQTKREENIRLTLDMAAKIQLGILPKPLNDKSFSLSAYIKPAKGVGGDFYDYIKLDDDRLLVCIADVSSKGFPAAMFMAEASILVKCNRNLSPEKILYNVNNNLCETNSENMFVTMFVGIIDRKRKVFEFANAGHNYPIIRNGNETKWLETKPDLLLGLFPDTEYHLNCIDIEKDFQIFLYTDGINEAEDINHSFFGNERLEKLYKSISSHNESTDKQLDFIIKELESFTKGAEQSDDITALIIKTA